MNQNNTVTLGTVEIPVVSPIVTETPEQRVAKALSIRGHATAAKIYLGQPVEADAEAKADILSAAISDSSVPYSVQNELIPMRNQFRAEEAKEKRLAREEAAKKRETLVDEQVEAINGLISYFEAAKSDGDLRGMRTALSPLYAAELQAGLIKLTGGAAERDVFRNNLAAEMALAESRVRVGNRQPRPLRPGELSGIRAKGKTQRDRENRAIRSGRKPYPTLGQENPALARKLAELTGSGNK